MRRRMCLSLGVLACALAAAVPASAAPADLPAARERAEAETALARVERLLDGRGVRTGRELTAALARLNATKEDLGTADRRRARSVLARPSDGASDPLGDGYSVPEATPHCTANFCVHYVTSTADAPASQAYVETMASVFESVRSVETGALGWADARSDGARGGGNGLTDVYIKDIGGDGLFGYAAPEEGSASSYSYLVLDDDYAEFGFANPLDALRVTAAHEYNHVLQFTYDSFQDDWMFEATAVWAEEQVYPAIDDYVDYLGAWAGCTGTPITRAPPSAGPPTACDLKMYGSAVWSHWLDARHGPGAIRHAFEVSGATTPTHFAPLAYSRSIADSGGAGFGDEFGRFAAAVAEWRAPGSPFPAPDFGSYPDVERAAPPLTTAGPPRTIRLDHTTFALIDVPPDPAQSAVQLRADVPDGLDASLALVGRTGSDPLSGSVTTRVQHLPSGGAGAVTLEDPGAYGRITAVLANSDVSQDGYDTSPSVEDWTWTRDDQPFVNVQIVPPGTPRPASNRTAAALSSAAPPARVALAARVTLHSPQRLATALSYGVLARVRCNDPCRLHVELRLDRATARRLRLPLVIGSRYVTFSQAGVKNARVKLSRPARARLRGRRAVRLIARARASRGGARSALLSSRVTLRR